ncbi:MAG: right-handed parallel beta-helix repeat-containing protein, partial [Victivallales bacterium]|nr:right-handed parallel beta-helix repeat-containing protein [Victivallales bacterium]
MLAINCTASVYYVNNIIGEDSHDGLSPDKPFKTIRHAMSKLSPGDTLIMASGCIFHESMIFQRSGTPSAPVTVEANGSILSGREKVPTDNWKQIEDGLWLNANHVQTGALRPRLFNGDRQMISVHFQIKPQDLKEGEAVWNKNGIYYRAAAGEKPTEKEFYGTYKESGVVLLNHNYVVVNNIITENFANDGVNAHGSCRGLIFRNLISRWNGDDGFSIHEDVQACLYGAHLHHNDFGIQDISISRSSFFGVLSEDNRSIGGDFHGGMRSIEDSMFRNNGEMQLRFATNGATYMGLKKDNPLENARAYLKDVLVCGGHGAALQAKGKADVTAFQCTFVNTETGINVEEKGAIHLVLCTIANVGQNIVGKDATFTAASCVFSPAPMIWGDRKLEGDSLRNALGDATNIVQKTRFNDKYRVRSPILQFRKELKTPGFASPVDLPFIPKPPDDLLAAGPVTARHD